MQTQTSCAPHLGDAANGCLSTCSARWLSRFPGKQSAPYVRLPLGRSRSWITREGRRVKAALRRASLGLDPPPFPRNTSSYDGQASLPSGNLRFPLTFTYHGRLWCPLISVSHFWGAVQSVPGFSLPAQARSNILYFEKPRATRVELTAVLGRQSW